MSEDKWNKNQDSPLQCLKRCADRIKEAGKPDQLKEHSEKTEFLSRQHVDFKTIEGMKQLLQAVTWRVKIEQISPLACNIYVRKKMIPEVRRMVKEFGISGIHYEAKEIGWFECWFKRFQISKLDSQTKIGECVFFDNVSGVFFDPAKPKKQWCVFDLAGKDSLDYSAKATFERKKDGSIKLIDMELEKPEGK